MIRRNLVFDLLPFARFSSQLHGPAHWSRVRYFGAQLAAREGLPEEARACVEIFAWVHDLAREHDGGGNQHAIDGALYLDEVLPAVFPGLSAAQRETVRAAVRYHSDGMVAREAYQLGLLAGIEGASDLLIRTIGCCWDADRLDLPRVGIWPSGDLMSTSCWQEVLALSERIHGGPCDRDGLGAAED